MTTGPTAGRGAVTHGHELVRTFRRRAISIRGRRRRANVSWAILALDLIVLALVVLNVHGPIRFTLGISVALFVPGWAIVGLLRLENAALEFSLTVATSLAVLTIAAQLLITAHLWHLTALQIVVCVACAPSLLWQALDGRRLVGELP